MQRLFRASKWLHKYAGLLLILFLAWMSVTGVLMNHPRLISGLSVPGWLLPPQYRVENWNRNALIDVVYSTRDPNLAFAGGTAGVWVTRDGGRRFEPFVEGLPASRYYRKTRDLLLWSGGGREILLAATDGGVFMRPLAAPRWEKVELAHEIEPVKKLLLVGDRLVVAATSGFYESPLPPTPTSFRAVKTARAETESRVTLVKLFFDLHYGKVWGLLGLLLFDATGVVLFFLCVSAFYTWYFPWQSRRNKKSALLNNRLSRRAFKTMFRYHLKLGIWLSAVLLVIGGTGLFMRPPLLAAIAGRTVSSTLYPGFLPNDPWHEKIQNALHDDVEGAIIAQATDGLWIADESLTEPFRPHDLDVPIFVMGASVMETEGPDGYLVGSFAGLYRWRRDSGTSVDVMTGREVTGPASLKPGEHMVTGHFRTPAGESFVATFEQGLVPLDGARLDGRFALPSELRDGLRMPLWNYLFEIHNGRFFADVVGRWHMLIIPIGSMAFLLITLSGIYDWVYLKVLRKASAAGDSAEDS